MNAAINIEVVEKEATFMNRSATVSFLRTARLFLQALCMRFGMISFVSASILICQLK